MPTYEGLRLKVRNKLYIPLTRRWREKTLRVKEFTIISNNCWGGTVYESYNLSKQSPTVGLFFMAEDYIRFLSDLRGYLESELEFIQPEESKWRDAPQVSGDKRFGIYPVGRLKDIELFFLHYHSQQEAKDKWERRIKRIHWDRLLVKFNDQNGCTEKHVEAFTQLPFKNKVFFTCKEWNCVPKEAYTMIRQLPRHDFIMASYEPFGKSRYLDLTAVINGL